MEKKLKNYSLPKPFIDGVAQLNSAYQPMIPTFAADDFSSVLDFLQQYAGNQSTFEAYRREIERFIQWAWRIEKKSILILQRQDIENYLAFCLRPPKAWIGTEQVPRFILEQGERKPNPKWRPFLAKVTKSSHKNGMMPDKGSYQLSQKAIQEIFTGLNSFYSYLILSEKATVNPVALIKQKNKYLQKRQQQATVMRLSETQWQSCFAVAKELAVSQPERYERTLFILSALYLLYLRISELVATDRWLPQMGHFYQDSHGYWWFKTVGKGNKLRNIAVSDDMLAALKRYRQSLHLTALPLPNEQTPLIPKEKGNGAMTSTRQIRRLVQHCFDQAVEKLKHDQLLTEAQALQEATVHWLRHTGISDDINKRGRPIAHVRDDAGHSSSATTDRYNDIELKARHQSARRKKLVEETEPAAM